MAQRSARARVKLGKLSQDSSGPPQPNQQNTGGSGGSGSPGLSSLGANNPPIPFGAYHGISKSTSFNPSTGLLTPSTSSIATGSSGHSGGASGGRHGFSFYNKGGSTNAVRSKSALRAFFEGHSERTRGRLEDLIRVKRSAPPSNSVPTPANSRVSLGMGLNMGGLGEIREENLPKVKRWDGGGKSGIEGWNELKKVGVPDDLAFLLRIIFHFITFTNKGI